MAAEGPWDPVEETDADEEGDDREAESERGFWDYALIGVVVVLVALVAVVVVSSQGASTQWSLDIRGELGEQEEAVFVTEDDVVVFDAAVGFSGSANGDVVEDVQVRAIGQNGRTIGTRCIGTLTNDEAHEFRTFQFNLSQEPDRVIIEATAVHNDSERYLVRGWSSDGGAIGGQSMFEQAQSSYINESACR